MADYSERAPPCVFVRDLPMGIRLKLRRILDLPRSQRNWMALAAEMDYTIEQVEQFKLAYHQGPNSSPTLEMLHEWGTRNKTVDELVRLLRNINNIEAIKAIFDEGENDESLPPVQISAESQRFPNVLPGDERSIQEVLMETERRQQSAYTGPSATSEAANGSSGPSDHQPLHRNNGTSSQGASLSSPMQNQDQPAPEANPESSKWPLKPGSVRKVLIRAERDAVNKAGMANVDYSKLKANTNKFSDRLLSKGGSRLGAGGYGSVFFLEMTRHEDKSQVACKRMHQAMYDESAALQFINELSVLTLIQVGAVKNNVQDVLKYFVELKAFSVNGPCPCLIYEFVPIGSLSMALNGEDQTHPFTWEDRHKVAATVADALQYLHTGRFGAKIIHGDVKSSNILLDEMFAPKLGDFGVARVLNQEDGSVLHQEHLVVAGTNAYMAPEARRGHASVKSDAYSFGIVLLELLTGKKAFDTARPHDQQDLRNYMKEQERALPDLVKRAYVNLDRAWPEALYMQMYRVAFNCLETKVSKRVAVAEIVGDLQRLTDEQVMMG
ncbi:interleukin-1 receptor-associated kinase 4-like [Sycon ciliatum]|uniref:interleukin-1 receptor-associated kinase 4-like n=1 Tax=Sycon ciliatum TaxID=27933 RepID=UPI0031F62540